MKKQHISVGHVSLDVYTLNTVVVGSGAAGFNAADRLHQLGQTDIALVTEGINTGTSRNTGSDKQTYYKLTLSGGDADSVHEMAQTLFSGECVDGDIALCEAALSAQGFLHLVDLGVPFPRNRYGEYIGYKTDHDPRRRATSVGPYTSKQMTECLERSVKSKNISIFDGLQAVRILHTNGTTCGLLCLDKHITDDTPNRFVAFCCTNIVWATGGPAGMYQNSVYPFGHYGATGVAFLAGAKGKNLTEWQYGLASVLPRWNVSGTYMQVLPQFISTNADGSDRREFLYDFFGNEGELLTNVFLKGYQWPFDVRKVAQGSSIIDILVYLESKKGRKVYLDFRQNPGGYDVPYGMLSEEARAYLEKADACFGTPIQRLLHMNAPAVAFYKDKGIDLKTEPLEIALCAQHNNGGLAIDCWWQTNIKGLFCAGESAASHGVYRPGGSALNAGQVGSMRAAQYIAARGTYTCGVNSAFMAQLQTAIQQADALCAHAIGQENTVNAWWSEAAAVMSECGAAIRNEDGLQKALALSQQLYAALPQKAKVTRCTDIWKLFRLEDILVCQQMYLSAMLNYLQQGGKSRGSALYTDVQGTKPYAALSDAFTFTLDDGSRKHLVQEISWKKGHIAASWRTVRPMPQDDDFFENVWRTYRETGNIE